MSERVARQGLRAAASSPEADPQDALAACCSCASRTPHASADRAPALARRVSERRVDGYLRRLGPRVGDRRGRRSRGSRSCGDRARVRVPRTARPTTSCAPRDVVVDDAAVATRDRRSPAAVRRLAIADPAGQDLDTRSARSARTRRSRHRPARRSAPDRAVAVITDIHANLPALQAALARIDELGIDEIYCGGDLVGYGPHPNEVCALIAEREIPTIYGNYDYAIARDLDDCGCAYITTRTTASSASGRSSGRSSTPTSAPRTSCASCRSTCASPSATHPCTSSTARRARSTSTSSRTNRRACTNASPPPRPTACSSSATPTSRGCTSTAACCSSTAARSASPRTATRAAPSPSSRHDAPDVDVTIERVPYDAEAVAREVAAAGLPAEYADKLLAAA